MVKIKVIITEKYLKDLKENLNNVSDMKVLQGKSILITGVTGLIGSAVADMLLEANESMDLRMEVWLASRNSRKVSERFKYWENKYNTVYYDALEKFVFEGHLDYIIHCASPAHPHLYASKPVETLMANVMGTNSLLEYARNSKIKRFLYVSSSEIYGNKAECSPYKENEYSYVDILNPRACYPSGKRAAETLCAAYTKEYDVDTVIVRPGHVYGPTITEGDTRAHAQFVRDVINNRDIVMKSEGLQLRSYCHVYDCVTAMLTVLLYGKKGSAYNISNRDSVVTIKQFAEMNASLTGLKVVYDVPKKEESAGYNMMTCSALNADKLYGLGWRGLYDLREGVSNTIELMKSMSE